MNALSRPCSWSPRWPFRSLLCLFFVLGMVFAAEHGKDAPKDDPKSEPPKKDGEDPDKDDKEKLKARRDAYMKHVKAGRAAFAKRNYAEALTHFRDAMKLFPDNSYAPLIAGVAAYWNREPRTALEYWKPLAEKAQEGSPREWEAMRHLVLAHHGLKEDEEAEKCAQRLYALRAKTRLAQALEAKGFTRQHYWLGKRRVGVWEVFDERGELPRVWEYEVIDLDPEGEKVLARLAVELESRADGKVNYALVELDKRRRVHKRWPAKPKYIEARDAALEAIKGRLKYLDAGTSVADGPDPATKKADTKKETVPEKKAEPATKKRVATPDEKELLKKIVDLKLSPAATRILAVAARLADVDFDVSRYVRLSVSDPAAARKFEAQYLTKRYPHATSDASDLVQYIASAKAPDCAEAFKHVGTVVAGPEAEYARYVLLTALNTRGGKPPVDYLTTCLGSEDFVVRQTAALLLARGGKKEGLEALFKEIASAGEGQAANEVSRIVSFYLEELIGSALGSCPLDDGGPWRDAALAWWKTNGPKLGYVQGAPAGEPMWRVAQ